MSNRSLGALLLMAAGLASPIAGAQEPIKIGHVAALSGASAQSGEAITRGLTIAIDEINAKGGLLGGRKLELVQRDDESNPPKGVVAVRELISKEKVAAIFGGIDTPVGLASISVINKEKTPYMAVWAAGTGITHSEFNPSATEPVHLYQIWLRPEREGLEPSYEQRAFPEEERRNRLRLVASPDGHDGSLAIRQDARLYLATLDGGREVSHDLAPGRRAWLQVLRGNVAMKGHNLKSGDGAAVSDERRLNIQARGNAEIMLFDLA